VADKRGSAPLSQRVPEADRNDGLTLLVVAVHVDNHLAAEPLIPLRAIDHQDAPRVGPVTGIRDLTIGVGQSHLLGNDDWNALDCSQHAGQQRGIRADLVHRPEIGNRLHSDERANVHHPDQFRGPYTVLAHQRPDLVEHVIGHGRVMVVGLTRVVHQRQVQKSVVADQPVSFTCVGI
jgi:hypothetical protein